MVQSLDKTEAIHARLNCLNPAVLPFDTVNGAYFALFPLQSPG